MIENKKTYYPNSGQSWGIVGIVILSMLLFSPLIAIPEKILGKEISFLVMYLLIMGVPFGIAHFIRNKRTAISTLKTRAAIVNIISPSFLLNPCFIAFSH